MHIISLFVVSCGDIIIIIIIIVVIISELY